MSERKKVVEMVENSVVDVSSMNLYKKMLAIESEHRRSDRQISNCL